MTTGSQAVRLVPRLKNAQRVLAPAAWGVADQTLSAAANFIINLALIRWLEPQEYGAFAVTMSWLLLLGGLHNSLLLEPMLVFGSAKYRDAGAGYLGAITQGHWAVSAVLGGVLVLAGAGAFLFGPQTLSHAFLGGGIAAPGILLLALARRVHYLKSAPRPAAIGGALYLAAALGGVFSLDRIGHLSPFSAYLLMGAVGLVVGVGLLRRQGVALRGRPEQLPVGGIARDHWDYGRWVIASTIASWIPGNLYFFVLPAMHGLEATGILAALMLFLRPVMTVAQPLAMLMVPRLVRLGSTPDATREMIAAVAAFSAGSLAYWAALALWHEPLTALVLGPEYRAQSHLLVTLGGFAPLLAVAVVLASGLRAGMRPDLEFKAHLFSAVVAIVVGLPLVLIMGLNGAAIGLPVSMAALAVAMGFLFFTRVSHTSLTKRCGP
ncbi:lipopolysaccharide biosynthesis protein [Azospirillum sp. sgz301742]